MHRVKNLNEFKLDICTYLKLISRATLEKVNATHILVYFTRLKCIFWCPELWSHFTILDFIFCVFPKFTSILAPSFYVFLKIVRISMWMPHGAIVSIKRGWWGMWLKETTNTAKACNMKSPHCGTHSLTNNNKLNAKRIITKNVGYQRIFKMW